MENSLLIKGGTIVNSYRSFRSDVLIADGKIINIDDKINYSADNIIDADGLHIFPGIIDPQVHFREPGMTNKEDIHTGSIAAAAGGITSFLEMPNTKPPTTTGELIAEKKKMAAERSVVNYNFFIGATPDNVEELNAVDNVPGIKIFMGASTGNLLVSEDKDLDKIFGNGTRLIAVHAENDRIIKENQRKYKDSVNFDEHRKVRDVDSALSATRLAVKLSKKYKRRLHILHLTTMEEAEFLSEAKFDPLITAEVTPQHLSFHAPDCYERLGALAQMNPPIREKHHCEALWQGLDAGIIDCIATDHAPHTLKEKDRPFGGAPSGMPGVETSLAVMLNHAHNGRCTVNEVVKWMCEKPAELYRMQGKGRVLPGYDADIAVVDLKEEKVVVRKNLLNKSGWSPFEGEKLTGWNKITIVGGKIVYKNGTVNENIRGSEIKFY